MVSDNESRQSDSPPAASPDLPHVRPLERIPSHLSQTSTLVGSEPTDDRLDSQEPSTSDSRPARHGTHGELFVGGSRDRGVADVKRPGSAKEEKLNFGSTHRLAVDRVRELHVVCDPIVDLIDDMNDKMGAAERLSQAGEFEVARGLYLDVLRDIRRFKFGTS